MPDPKPEDRALIELKPCPFCGTKLVRNSVFSTRKNDCYVHVQDLHGGDYSLCPGAGIRLYSKHDERIALWNRRCDAARAPSDGGGDWVMVPTDPTSVMLDAAIDTDPYKLGDLAPLAIRYSPQELFRRAWVAMLAAAPKHDGGEPVAWAVRTAKKDGSWGAWWIATEKPDASEYADAFGAQVVALSPTGGVKLDRQVAISAVRAALTEQWEDSVNARKWTEDVLLTGCRQVGGGKGYERPDEAANNLAGMAVDAILALPPSAPGEAWRELPDGLPARGPVMVGSAEWDSVLVEDYDDLAFFLERLAKWGGGPTHWRVPPAGPAALQTKEQSDA